jgi:tetratricopeptide (TPR) repeat protein
VKRKFQIVLLVFLVMLVPACSNPALNHVKQGDAFCEQRQWSEAIIEYEKAVELDKTIGVNAKLARTYANRAEVWNESADYDKAIADFTKASELDPTIELGPILARAYAGKAEIYLQNGECEKAAAQFAKASELDVNLVMDRNSRSAKCHYDRLAAYMDEEIKRYLRGGYATNNEEGDLAIAKLGKALELNPDCGECYYGRGLINYIIKKRNDLAISDLDRAIELDPSLSIAYVVRGWVHNAAGNLDLAFADSNRAIELDPDFAEAYVSRGWSYVDKKQPYLALVDFNKAIEVDPNCARAYNERGAFYGVVWGMRDSAFADFERAIELEPDFIMAYYNRALCYDENEQWDLAIADLNKVLQLATDPVFIEEVENALEAVEKAR